MMDNRVVLDARKADLEQYLKNKGEMLIKEGRQYRVKGHGGLFVSGNHWYSHSLSKGGNAIDYLVLIEGINFKEALSILSTRYSMIPAEKRPQKAGLVIPERNENDKRVMAYLMKFRGINADILLPLLKKGRIYEAKHTHNCVFSGIDSNNQIRYIMQRSSNPNSSFKCETAGSDKRYSFSLCGKSRSIYLFESPLDLLSYATYMKENPSPMHHMLSLGGVCTAALEYYLSYNSNICNIVLCLDRDDTGIEACRKIYGDYSRGFSVDIDLPKMKDWNLQLLHDKKISSTW